MERVLEPEVMDDPDQARAYAEADFSEENESFVTAFAEFFPEFVEGHLLDLGCGPGDIPIRLARRFPLCRITGVDASLPMIRLAEEAVKAAGLTDRITLRHERYQTFILPERVDAVISNSLLHHIPNPLNFWYAVKRFVKPGGAVLVMDLLRPESPDAARAIVEQYAAGAPSILRRDFYNSLCAAFTEDEIAGQLAQLNLTRLLVDVPDDRHWIAGGHVY